jgi:hypothetical protein
LSGEGGYVVERIKKHEYGRKENTRRTAKRKRMKSRKQ